MKHLTLIFSALLLCSLHGKSQISLVPNGSFENKIKCPSGASDVTAACSNWVQYTNGTPDYFNVCNTNRVGVPTNDLGSQQPAHGNAYCGFIAHASLSGGEYISVGLIQPLTIGEIYEVSMSVSRADNSKYATNNIGVFFFDSGAAPGTLNTTSMLTYVPQIEYTSYGIITDTANWTRLAGSFTADSTYDNIIIGSFYKNNSYAIDTFSGTFDYAYYYVDSVVIKKKSFKILDYDTLLCAGDSITAECAVSLPRNNNNTFTLQLSDKNGSFASPLNIGTKNDGSSGTITGVIPNTVGIGTGYRMRIISSSPADTSDTTSIVIKIDNIDSSNVLVGVTDTICSADTLKFSASTSIASTTYQWTGPAGFNTNKADTNLTSPQATNSGVYYSTIKFYGCTVKDTFDILVKSSPAKPTVSNNTPICVGDILKLTGSSTTSGITYVWTGPNSYTSTQQNPVLPNSTTSMSGVYTQTAVLNGCSSSNTTTVNVKPNPDTFYLSVNSPLCEGDTMQVQSTGAGTGVSYSWTGPGSYTAGTQNVMRIGATLNMSGWYKLVAALNNCTYEDSIQVTVNQIPAAPTTTFSDPLCVGETLSLTAASLSGATYKWNGPNGFNSSQQNPVRTNVTLADTGTYTVTATNNTCESPAASLKVSINPQPFVVIFSNKDSLCAGEQVIFTALPNNTGGTPTYQWYVNAQAVGTGTTYTSTGINHNDIIRVDMTEYTKCSQNFTDPSNDIQMTVLPWLAPSVTITSDKTGPIKPYHYITFTATATNAGNSPEYQWKRNGTDVLGAKSSQWSANTLSDNDSINVEVKSSYRCPEPQDTFSNGIVVKVLTSVGEIAKEGALHIYPNPGNGKFIIDGVVLEANGMIRVEVINALGQRVYHNEIVIQNHIVHHEVELSALTTGNYLLRLQDEAGGFSVYKLKVQ